MHDQTGSPQTGSSQSSPPETSPSPTGSPETGPVGDLPGSPVVVYDTEVRVGGEWHHAPRLVVHLDRGEPSEVAELSWRSSDGSEAVIAFEDGMGAFRGHRSADGLTQDYRGVERERWSGPDEVGDVRAHVFATEEDGDGDRTVGGRLRLLLDDGRGPVERVTWRDRRGAFASVVLRDRTAVRSTVPVAVREVVASDEHRRAGEVARNLLTAGQDKWLAFASTATLDFVLSEPAVVTAYQLTAANDYRDRDPRDWRLRGSMDGRTWYTIDSRVDQAFPRRFQERGYAVANSTAYSHYRLDISRNWGRQEETQLNRVRLLTTDEAELVGTPVPVSQIVANGENRRSGEVAVNLLDAGAGKWLTFTRTAWLEFLLPKPTAVTAYALTSANDHCSRDPKDWVLQGSHDGDTWVTLDQRVGENFSERFLVREFTTANTTRYSRYRLRVTANAEGVGEVQLHRVQLLAKDDDGFPARREFSGVLRHDHGPAVGYRGATAVSTDAEGPDGAGGDGTGGDVTAAAPVTESDESVQAASEPDTAPAEGFAVPDSWTPEMRDKVDRFREQARKYGIPSEDVERWLGLARRCAVLSPDVKGPVVGRFGAPVKLPADVPVPSRSSGSGDRPEHLVATLDLAALPGDATNLALPADGHLLLFAWPTLEMAEDVTCTGGHAVYVPAGTEVEERGVEYDYGPRHFLAHVDFDGELHGELRLRHDVSLPDHEFSDNDPVLAEHPRAEELRELWSDLESEDPLDGEPLLRIGGYAEDGEGWGDPVSTCANAAEEDDPSRTGDWVLLAQWEPSMENLECATLYWAITEQDLAARRFDPVRVTMYANP